jgi:tetratricopeptide (TPR) repeat protein
MRKSLRRSTVADLLVCVMLSPALWLFAEAPSASTSSVIEDLQKGEYDDAVRVADVLLRADPRSYKVWTLRAMGLERSGHPKEALNDYQHALNLSPNYLPALEGAAQLDYKAQSNQAIPILRRILVAKPESATAHAMLGVLEYRRHDFAAAVGDFDAAGDLTGSQPNALMAYGISLAHLKRDADAIQRFQQLLALQPENADARYDLALLEWRTSTAADALDTLGPLLDGQVADSQAMRLAAAIHESNNETPQAIEMLRGAIAADPNDVSNYLDFATLAATHGSFAVGVDILNIGIKQLPNSSVLYMARGVLYGQNADTEKAMADFERAHALDPSNTVAASAEGIAQSQSHKHEAALEDFKRQVREHPNDAYGHYLLAEAISWSPNDEKSGAHRESLLQAISEARKATEIDPRLVQAYDLLGSLYLQTEQIEPAIKECRTALKIEPKDQQSLYTLILALRKTSSKDELKSLVQRLTELRKEEGVENSQKAKYGQLVEERSGPA